MKGRNIGLLVAGCLILLAGLWLIRYFNQPVIGIPQTRSEDYANAVRKAGGRPVSLEYNNAMIPKHLSSLDGLLLPGGADIDPKLYGDEEIHPTVKLVSEERYTFESELTKQWLEQTGKPFLGVCLGCQLLNVVSGGTLVQDIPSEFGGNHRKDHAVDIDKDSKLGQIFQATRLDVNSRHHQCVRDIGEGLKVAARAPDGMIEAIEQPGERFVIGVQWHPEDLIEKDRSQRKLFREFIKAAKRGAEYR